MEEFQAKGRGGLAMWQAMESEGLGGWNPRWGVKEKA